MDRKEKFERLLNSRAFKDAMPETQLAMMFEFHTLRELVEKGHVFDVEGARMKLGGIAAWSLRRRCRKGQQSHILLGEQYVFLPSQLKGAIKAVPATA